MSSNPLHQTLLLLYSSLEASALAKNGGMECVSSNSPKSAQTLPWMKGIPQRLARTAGAGSGHPLRARRSARVPLTLSPLSRSNAPWIKSNLSASFFILLLIISARTTWNRPSGLWNWLQITSKCFGAAQQSEMADECQRWGEQSQGGCSDEAPLHGNPRQAFKRLLAKQTATSLYT